jgi:mannose-6-phosphate isomerase-like protein (cupin superfamily)
MLRRRWRRCVRPGSRELVGKGEKSVKRFIGGVVVGWATIGVAVVAQSPPSEKIIQPQVITDNQKVRMVRWSLQPGERSPVHTHALDHIYVVIHGSRIRDFISGDGTHDDDQETGRAAFSAAVGKTHYFQNVGQQPYEMVSIELK